jgi:hypothetical protein
MEQIRKGDGLTDGSPKRFRLSGIDNRQIDLPKSCGWCAW